MTIFVLEDIEAPRLKKVFRLMGTDLALSPQAWLNPILMGILGIVIALIAAPVDGIALKIVVGIVYGLLIMISSFLHGLGHVISSQLINSPVQTLIATATVFTTSYDKNEGLPSLTHIGRALGGPVLNLLIGIILIGIYALVISSHFLLFFSSTNLLLGLFTLAPIPTLDGSVIVREMLDWKDG